MAADKETIYDEQIEPLMAEIIRICKEHKIAMLADFALGADEDGDDLFCSTQILTDDCEPPAKYWAAAKHLRPKAASVVAITCTAGGKEGMDNDT